MVSSKNTKVKIITCLKERMTTSISSEAKKLWMDIGKKTTIKQCHTVNINLDTIRESRNL